MKAIYVLEMLNSGELDILKESAEKEIREQAYKQAGGDKARLKAVQKFAKQAAVENDIRPTLAGAWIDDKGRMCMVDGHSAYRLKQCYPDVKMAQDGDRVFDIERVMKAEGDRFYVKAGDILEGYAKAKAEAKAAGIPWSKAKLHRPVLMAGSYWNVELLATFARIMGDCDITKAGKLSPLYASNEIGEGVVLPIHPKAAQRAVCEIPAERKG